MGMKHMKSMCIEYESKDTKHNKILLHIEIGLFLSFLACMYM